jgi:signal transduction histidine kinase
MAISAISTSDLNTSNQQIISNVSMQAESAIRSVQEVANNLNPQILHRFGLHKAIATFVDGMALNPTLQVEFISNIKSNRYDYPVELALYRIVGELITNTIRHAQASKIQISINEFDSYLKLIYTDNGIGFDTRMQDSKGLGMLNMHSRIKSLGGEIEIQTKPNNGFIAHVKVPFKAPMIDFNTHIND